MSPFWKQTPTEDGNNRNPEDEGKPEKRSKRTRVALALASVVLAATGCTVGQGNEADAKPTNTSIEQPSPTDRIEASAYLQSKVTEVLESDYLTDDAIQTARRRARGNAHDLDFYG